MKEKIMIFSLMVLICSMVNIGNVNNNILAISESELDEISASIIIPYNGELNGFSCVYWNLDYKYKNYDILKWTFTSTEKTIDVKLLTHTEFEKYLAFQSYTYWELSTGLLEDSGLRLFPQDNSFYIVFENNHFFKTEVYLSPSLDKLTADISYMNINYIDYDGDGYNDDFEVTFKIIQSHILLISYITIEYKITMEKIDGSYIDSFQSSKISISASGYTKTFGFDNDYTGKFKVTLRTYYYFDVYSTTQDDIEVKTLSEIYPIGYGEEQTPTLTPTPTPNDTEDPKSYGLLIGLLTVGFLSIITSIITVVVVRNRKKKKLQETETIEPELEEQRFCPTCGDILEESGIFCANCGVRLGE